MEKRSEVTTATIKKKPSFPDIPQEEYRARISKATQVLEKRGHDALFVTMWENVYYLSGLNSASMWSLRDLPHCLILKKDGSVALIVPVARFLTEETAWVEDIRVYFKTTDALDTMIKTFADLKLKGARVGAELGEMQAVRFSTGLFLDLKKETGAEFVDGSSAIWDLRMIKSKLEIERIRQAANIAGKACERSYSKLTDGMTERDFARLVSQNMIEEGADRIIYVMIQSGEKFWKRIGGSFPSERKIRRGDYVQLDFGAIYRHYTCDLNRLGILGAEPKPSEKDHWNLFVEANHNGTKAVRPGARIADVFSAISNTFEQVGYRFKDRPYAGHGLGLEAHEAPLIAPNNNTIVNPGMVLAIEPSGVTNKEGFWANCEDDVVCTETGVEKLSTLRQEIFVV